MAYNRISIWYRITIYRRIFYICIYIYIGDWGLLRYGVLFHSCSLFAPSIFKKMAIQRPKNATDKKKFIPVRICLNFKNYTLLLSDQCPQISSISNISKLFFRFGFPLPFLPFISSIGSQLFYLCILFILRIYRTIGVACLLSVF